MYAKGAWFWNKAKVWNCETVFFEKDIVYTAPGLKDYVTVYGGGKKQRLRKHYLTMFLREAFSVFKARYPEISISFIAFCKIRPKNVLLLKNTPMDQCKCKVHEKFIFKLSAWKINYHDNFWEKCLCKGHSKIFTSTYWAGECQECLGGKKIPFIKLPIDQIITYNEWIVDDGNNQWCMAKTCTTQLLQSLVMNDYPTFQQHVKIKRIQEARFLEDKAKADVGISQIDFAMAYSCEY